MRKTKDKLSHIEVYSYLNDLFRLDKHLNKRSKLALLIKLEVDRIIFDINTKRELLYKLWSKQRTREPLIRVLSSRFYDLSFSELMFLSEKTNILLDNFYRSLNDFKFYVNYTEDMPQTMKNTFDTHFRLLNTRAKKLLEELELEIQDAQHDTEQNIE